jgi:anti-anti-sigma factor
VPGRIERAGGGYNGVMPRAGSILVTPGATSFVRLAGEHDALTEGQVRAAILAEIEAGRHVVVSLERVSLLGSPVIGALVAAQLQAEAAGLRFALVVPAGAHRARRSLDLTGLLDSLQVFERARDALRHTAAVAPLALAAVAG